MPKWLAAAAIFAGILLALYSRFRRWTTIDFTAAIRQSER